MKRKLLSVLLVLVLALGLLPTTAFADGEAHPNIITIANTPITAGKYYVPKTGGGIQEATDTPISGYVLYNKDTGVLTLNNVSIEASGGAYGITSSDSGTLTIDLTGSNTITVTGTAGGIKIEKTDCTITDTGSLTVTCEKMSALQVKSLTVDSAVTLSFTTKGTGDDKAILADNNISLKKATVTATATAGNGAAISSTFGSVTIGDGANVTAKGVAQAIYCDKDFSVTGGKLKAENTGEYDAVWVNGNILVSGGTLEVTSTYAGGLCTAQDVEISGNANVTINTAGTCIYTGDEGNNNITVSGGTLKLTSTDSNCFYTNSGGTGKIVISGGMTTASSSSVTLWGNSIEISGGTVTASSSAEAGIYSPATVTISGGTVTANAKLCAICGDKGVTISNGNITAISANKAAVYVSTSGCELAITGGTLAASTENTATWYTIESAGTILIDGDAVVYVYDTTENTNWISIKKGVVYKGTTVSLDTNGKTVLSGGVGTVYDNPNVTGFTKPTGSKLGTKLNGADAHYITITTSDVPSGGSPEPEVKVTKTALNTTLVKGTDYTVDTGSEDLTTLGEKTAKIVAVENSGNIGEKEFAFTVVAATNDDENNDDANGSGNEVTGGEHHRVNRQNTTTATTDTAKTDTTKADTVTSAKTFDVGTAVYGLLAVTSLLGMGYVGKKR